MKSSHPRSATSAWSAPRRALFAATPPVSTIRWTPRARAALTVFLTSILTAVAWNEAAMSATWPAESGRLRFTWSDTAVLIPLKEKLRALVEGSAGRVVPRLADHLVAERLTRQVERRVAARDHEGQKGIGGAGLLEKRGENVALEMVDADQREPPDVGEGLRHRAADEERPDEARPLGHRDGLQIGEGDPGVTERLLDDRDDDLEVAPRRQLGHHAAVGRVDLVLGGHDGGQDLRAVRQDRRRRLVAGGLDPQDQLNSYFACACGVGDAGRALSRMRIAFRMSTARWTWTSFFSSSSGEGGGTTGFAGSAAAATTFGGSTMMSGVMPLPWIERPFGVKYLAVVRRSPDPSVSGMMVWTDPLPKVCVPRTMARPQSWSAPATISEAEALPWLTSTTMGKSR